MPLRPGDRVERYEVIRAIGRGGMATVFQVKHLVLGTMHALKLLHHFSPRLRDELIREGRLQARLDPAFIVPVHDVLEVDGAPALLMPLVKGCSLRDVYQRHAPDQAECASIFSAIALGVAEAHEQGVVHRDLKPENILLDIYRGKARIRVADFGLGVVSEMAGEQAMGFAGTPAYAAPEQLLGLTIPDRRADLWSIGIMLYEALTGSRPFVDGDHSRPPSAFDPQSELTATVPPLWRPLVQALLHPNVDERGPPARDLATAIQQVVEPAPLDRSSPVSEAIHLHKPLPQSPFTRASLVSMESPSSADTVDTFNTDMDSVSEYEVHSTRNSNLPDDRNAWIDRPDQIARIAEVLSAGSRVVSLFGTGGIGKTRLAIAYARSHELAWNGGVWICNMSEAKSQDGLCAAVGRALNVPLSGESPSEQIGHAIAARGRVLMVLDSVEHIAGELPAALRSWQTLAPEAVFLLTTRSLLNVSGEVVLEVPPLAPDLSQSLFIARAKQISPWYAPDEAQRRTIAELVARLDHLPLAIELAAARTRVMSPKKMLARLSDRFRLLAGSSATIDRHSTLKAAIEWSWNLLSPAEQMAMSQLAVCHGGFSMEAAESILDLSAYPNAPWEIDVVQSLVDKALLRTGGEDRFSMFASVQDYALQVLRAHGDEQSAHKRHAAYFAAFGTAEAIEDANQHGGAAHRALLGRNIDNLMTALNWSIAHGSTASATDTLCACFEVLRSIGPIDAAVGLANRILEMEYLNPLQEVRVLDVAGRAEMLLGRAADAIERFRAALSHAESAGERSLQGMVLGNLGWAARQLGDPDEAERCYAAALAIHGETGNRRLAGMVLMDSGLFHLERGQRSLARANLTEAGTIHARVGNRRAQGITESNLGRLSMQEGDLDTAAAHYKKALKIARGIQEQRHEGIALSTIGMLKVELGDLEGALTHYRQALSIARSVGDRRSEAYIQMNCGEASRRDQAWKTSEEHFQEALTIAQESWRALEGIILGSLGDVQSLSGNHSQALATIHRAQVAMASSGYVPEVAKFQAKAACVFWRAGEHEAARRSLANAEATAAKLRTPDSAVTFEIARAVSLIHP